MENIAVLIVEDNDVKYEAVRNALFPKGSYRQLDRAPDFSSAQRLLEVNHYDLVILDVRVPNLKGRTPARQYSRDIVELITRGQAINPSYIIGLTEYPEEITTGENYPIEYYAIEKYSTCSDEWKVKLSRHIEYISRTKIASLNFHESTFDYDVVILTARHENEFIPIVDAINWEERSLTEDPRFPGFKVKTGIWNTSADFALKTAVVCIQRVGLASAAAATSLAISRYRPRFLSMLGMCCGLNGIVSSDPQRLGDIVIMSDTFCWDEGRYSDLKRAGADRKSEIAFFEARPVSGNMSPILKLHAQSVVEIKQKELSQRLQKIYASHSTASNILSAGKEIPKTPKTRVGLNVSGSSVVAASSQSKEIQRRFSNAIALEMECHAVYASAPFSAGVTPEAICIKGIADFGDGRKSKEYQQIASVGSLIVFEQVLCDYLWEQANNPKRIARIPAT